MSVPPAALVASSSGQAAAADDATMEELAKEYRQLLRMGVPPPPPLPTDEASVVPGVNATEAQMHAAANQAAETLSACLSSGKKKKKKKTRSLDPVLDSSGQPVRPADANVTGFKDPEDPLSAFGMSMRNAAGRTKLRNLQRLFHLIGSNRGLAEDEDTVSKKLEKYVLTGNQCATITEARAAIAELRWCAGLMHEDVNHLLNHPEDRTETFNKESADDLSGKLQKLTVELEARAGQPEELKSERAERMREKMEKRLLPTLNKEIPRQADRLRLILKDVIHYLEAEPMLVEEPEPEPAPVIKEEFKEWETKEEEQPDVSEEEARLLQSMGWEGSASEMPPQKPPSPKLKPAWKPPKKG